ncbi:MAG TPA: DUF2142 domain-containing protein [Anaerolineae bacterium]|nr:DUF2142 domain-containing protein [Anaerolineae bacterium]
MAVIRPGVSAFILAIYGLMGLVYAVLTPAWQVPDEPAHYNYVHYVATVHRFPELVSGCYDHVYLTELKSRRFPPELPIAPVCYEFHQPPLYYLLATPIFILSNGSLLVIRLVSVALGAGIIYLAGAITLTIFHDNAQIAYGTMALVAFVPMHLAILASVNNDALAELLFAIVLLLLVRWLLSPERPSIRSAGLVGLFLGLGLITKTTVYTAGPLVVIALSLRAYLDYSRGQGGAGAYLIRLAAISYGLALLIALPWFARNVIVYGGVDILGLARHDRVVVGQLRTADFVTQNGMAAYLGDLVSTTFQSFWGQFGWMAVPMDPRTYLLLALLSGLALVGVGISAWTGQISRASWSQKAGLLLMGVAIGLVVLAYLGYNLAFVQFQGRYLFPGLIPLGLFFSLGLNEVLQLRWRWWLAGGLLLMLSSVGVISGLNGQIDKWTLLILGLALLLTAARALLPAYETRVSSALWLACYGGLGWLALAAPFWFVVPYL